MIRVDFGDASFLFSGDLEEDGIRELLDRYESTDRLDVDVYQVGHHGSRNGSTVPMVQAMSPEIAVFSMGRWDNGIDQQRAENRFNTFWYGHPRKIVVDLLSEGIPQNRESTTAGMVFNGIADPVRRTIHKNFYATGWDGTIRIRAARDGTFIVSTENQD